MGRQVTLGEKYRDTITGFIGTATSRHEYLYGCVRVTLEGKSDGTNSEPQELTFDEQRLTEPAGPRPIPTATSGGTRPKPPRSTLR